MRHGGRASDLVRAWQAAGRPAWRGILRNVRQGECTRYGRVLRRSGITEALAMRLIYFNSPFLLHTTTTTITAAYKGRV